MILWLNSNSALKGRTRLHLKVEFFSLEILTLCGLFEKIPKLGVLMPLLISKGIKTPSLWEFFQTNRTVLETPKKKFFPLGKRIFPKHLKERPIGEIKNFGPTVPRIQRSKEPFVIV